MYIFNYFNLTIDDRFINVKIQQGGKYYEML